MRTPLTLCGALLIGGAFSQVTFQRSYGVSSGNEIGYSVEPTTDGGYILSGHRNVLVAQLSDGFMLKLDAEGDTLWTRSFGGSNYEHFTGGGQMLDGGYIGAGIGNGNIGSSDFFAVHTDASGTPLWSKSYGVFTNDEAYEVLPTSDGGCIIAGFTGSIGAGMGDILVVKTDANGDTLWTRAFGANTNESALDISETSDGDFVMVGSVYDPFVTFDTDIYVVRITAAGTIALVQSYGAAPPETIGDTGEAIAGTPDGGFIIAGRGANWGVAVDDILIKVDNVGTMEWAKSYGGDNLDYVYDVKSVPDGGYIFCGASTSTTDGAYSMAYAVRTDASGDTLWTRTYGFGLDQVFHAVSVAPDGGFIFTGFVRFGLGTGQQDIYVVKTDANGYSGCNEFASETVVADIAPVGTTQLALVNAIVNVVDNSDIVSRGTTLGIPCLSTAVGAMDANTGPLLYPQPTDGLVRLRSPFDARPIQVEVCDMLGAIVHSQGSPASGIAELDLSHLPSGSYVLQLTDGASRVTSKLLIRRE